MTKQPRGPQILPEYDIADASAIQALMIGEATSEQQQRALKWIIEIGAGTYDFNYYINDRDTAFALGRCFVGQQIVKLTKLNIGRLRELKNNEGKK